MFLLIITHPSIIALYMLSMSNEKMFEAQNHGIHYTIYVFTEQVRNFEKLKAVKEMLSRYVLVTPMRVITILVMSVVYLSRCVQIWFLFLDIYQGKEAKSLNICVFGSRHCEFVKNTDRHLFYDTNRNV